MGSCPVIVITDYDWFKEAMSDDTFEDRSSLGANDDFFRPDKNGQRKGETTHQSLMNALIQSAKVFGPAMRAGASRRFKPHFTTHWNCHFRDKAFAD